MPLYRLRNSHYWFLDQVCEITVDDDCKYVTKLVVGRAHVGTMDDGTILYKPENEAAGTNIINVFMFFHNPKYLSFAADSPSPCCLACLYAAFYRTPLTKKILAKYTCHCNMGHCDYTTDLRILPLKTYEDFFAKYGNKEVMTINCPQRGPSVLTYWEHTDGIRLFAEALTPETKAEIRKELAHDHSTKKPRNHHSLSLLDSLPTDNSHLFVSHGR